MHSNGKTLLLVEDEVLIAMSEKMDLEKYGYTVITTNSGEEAINTFKSRDHIDLILMDINLGSGMDGTETASTILEEQDIPIVFLSSHTSPEMVERTEKITSYGYVVKNSGITVLDASIKMAFRLFDEKQKVKENESRLMDTTELLENMMDAIPDSIGILDDNYTVIRYNEAGYQLLGLTPETTHGRKCYELVHRQEPCEVCAVKHCYKSKKIEEVERYASSIDKWIHLKAYPILDESGNIAQVIEHFRDITEQKHVEEKLRRSENTLQKTFDGIQDGISVLDNDLRILKVNRRITEWYKDELP
ncbi:MAG: response regulator, partial [Spirochaetota bacterium]